MDTSINHYRSNSYEALLHLLNTTLHTSLGKRIYVICPNQLVKAFIQRRLLENSETGGIAAFSFLELSPALIKFFKWNTRKNIAIPSKNLLALELERLLISSPPAGFDDVQQYVQTSPTTRIPPLANQLATAYLTLGTYVHEDTPLLYEKDIQAEWDTPLELIKNHLVKPEITADIYLFGFHHLPLAYSNLFEHIAEYMDVHLFSLYPTNQYIGDVNKYEPGNAHLMAQLGTMKRKEMNNLLDKQYQNTDVFLSSNGNSQLSAVKNGILRAEDGGAKEVDESLRLTSGPTADSLCSSIHEEILSSLMEGEKASEHLILVSDPETYYPLLEQHFSSREAAIPATYYAYESPSGLSQSLASFFRLATSRCTKTEVLGALEDMQDGMGITYAEMHTLSTWLDKTHFRWGLNQAHKKEQLGIDDAVGSLHMSLQLLAKGLVYLQNDSTTTEQYTPVSLEATQIDLAEKLNLFYEYTVAITTSMQSTRLAKEWKAFYIECVDKLYVHSQKHPDLRKLIKDLFDPVKDDVSYVGHSIHRYLLNGLQGRKKVKGGGFLDAVTVAPLQPEYCIPKKFVHVLGVDETHPGIDGTNIFYDEKLLKEYKPSKKDVFAGALLLSFVSAGDTLAMYHTTRDSVDGREQAAHEFIEQIHELYPMQRRCVDGVSFLSPKKRELLSSQLLRKAFYDSPHKRPISENLFAPITHTEQIVDSLSVAQLSGIFEHPLKYYTQKKLGIYLQKGETERDEKEFLFHALDKYHFKKHVNRVDLQELLSKLQAVGALPHASYSTVAQQKLAGEYGDRKALLAAQNVNQLYTYRFDASCATEHFLSDTEVVAPAPTIAGVPILGSLENISQDTLYVFERPNVQMITKHLGAIIAFSAFKPEGNICFLPAQKKYSAYPLPQNLLSHVLLAASRPCPLVPSLIPPLLADDTEGLKKKVEQLVQGYPFSDPYAELYLEKDCNFEQYIETWGTYAKTFYQQVVEWVEYARV